MTKVIYILSIYLLLIIYMYIKLFCVFFSVDKHGSDNKIGEQFTEIFIKHTESVGLVLTFLEESDFRVRWPAVKLLKHLLENRYKDIQEMILVSPMGVSKLMDLLNDSREAIRNEVR